VDVFWDTVYEMYGHMRHGVVMG